LRPRAIPAAVLGRQHVERVLLASLGIELEGERRPVRIGLPQVNVRRLVDQVEERVAVQLVPVGPTVIAAERETQDAAGDVIEIDPRVILVVLAAAEDDAVFAGVHEREEPVRPPRVLGDVDGILRELSGIEEARHLVVDRIAVGRVLEPRVHRLGDALGARHDCTLFVYVLSVRVDLVMMVSRPVDLPGQIIVAILRSRGEARRSTGEV
jgi:hypothetical protein